MYEVTGYRFNTESAALAAQTSLNAHYGIPVDSDAVTRNTSAVHEGVDADTGADVWYIAREEYSARLGDAVVISLEEES